MKKSLLLCLACLMLFACAAGCSQEKNTKNPTCEQVLEAVKEAIGEDDMPMMTDIDDDAMSALYGLSDPTAVLEDYRGIVSQMNVRADEILVMKVRDGEMEAAEAAVSQRQEDLDATWSQYLPEVYETVKDARVVKNGNYLLFVVSDDADDAVEAFDELTKG